MTIAMENVLTGSGLAPEELLSLRQQRERLLTTIAELLRTNEELRLKLARLEAQADAAH